MRSAYRAVLFDLDGTLTPVRSVWQHLHEALGQWDGEAERHQDAFRDGRISYEQFCSLDAAYWKGRSESELRAIADRIPYRDGVDGVLAAARSAGLLVGVISTGLTLLSDRVRAELGLEFAVANHLVARDGLLTGEVQVNVAHRRKEEAVRRFCSDFKIEPAEVISVGDSEGDISMFASTGYSIAFNPSGAETARAASSVCHGDSLLDLVPKLPLGAGAVEVA